MWECLPRGELWLPVWTLPQGDPGQWGQWTEHQLLKCRSDCDPGKIPDGRAWGPRAEHECFAQGDPGDFTEVTLELGISNRSLRNGKQFSQVCWEEFSAPTRQSSFRRSGPGSLEPGHTRPPSWQHAHRSIGWVQFRGLCCLHAPPSPSFPPKNASFGPGQVPQLLACHPIC